MESMKMTRDELKDKMAEHYEWVEAHLLASDAEARAEALLEDSLLDRFERDWADYAV